MKVIILVESLVYVERGGQGIGTPLCIPRCYGAKWPQRRRMQLWIRPSDTALPWPAWTGPLTMGLSESGLTSRTGFVGYPRDCANYSNRLRFLHHCRQSYAVEIQATGTILPQVCGVHGGGAHLLRLQHGSIYKCSTSLCPNACLRISWASESCDMRFLCRPGCRPSLVIA